MNIRRRIALLIDPSLAPVEYERPEETDLARVHWLYPNLNFGEMSRNVERVAKALERLEKRRRRPRIIECEHPELHEAA